MHTHIHAYTRTYMHTYAHTNEQTRMLLKILIIPILPFDNIPVDISLIVLIVPAESSSSPVRTVFRVCDGVEGKSASLLNEAFAISR